MDDQQTWQRALRAIDDWHRGLSEECRTQLGELIGRIMLLKEESLRLGLAAGSAEICRTCGGSCCRYGKYHVTILDLLAFRLNSIDPIANFDNFPFCPYGGDEGCLMPPRFRPLTCVIFNCDPIEERMGDDACRSAATLEGELREQIARAERLTGRRLGRPVLLDYGAAETAGQIVESEIPLDKGCINGNH
ncbi:hypothetical protein [Geobacter sp. SVR]|uniref:hypothetical protein n=1 Tax=Geobacter sp. SVR TaxID=2495594 RepID=UPI00143EF9D4|nr:hypothetical protein [Geobacter sp. SVR]BCS52284.1 hypothetical protein GSVR_05920 [Geobacter sp. SVR]GCF85057.1 hypothetical protein GSbR_16570 [Geobacter sp. SVR]